MKYYILLVPLLLLFVSCEQVSEILPTGKKSEATAYRLDLATTWTYHENQFNRNPNAFTQDQRIVVEVNDQIILNEAIPASDFELSSDKEVQYIKTHDFRVGDEIVVNFYTTVPPMSGTVALYLGGIDRQRDFEQTDPRIHNSTSAKSFYEKTRDGVTWYTHTVYIEVTR